MTVQAFSKRGEAKRSLDGILKQVETLTDEIEANTEALSRARSGQRLVTTRRVAWSAFRPSPQRVFYHIKHLQVVEAETGVLSDVVEKKAEARGAEGRQHGTRPQTQPVWKHAPAGAGFVVGVRSRRCGSSHWCLGAEAKQQKETSAGTCADKAQKRHEQEQAQASHGQRHPFCLTLCFFDLKSDGERCSIKERSQQALPERSPREAERRVPTALVRCAT